MKIGITCYPTMGGSGIVASSLGKVLAQKGVKVHFISYSEPFRLPQFHENIYYHEVEISQYPLFKYPPYTLNLATKMVEVIEEHQLDILHVHYAIPHTISAHLAKEMVNGKIKILTTLHGTDITLVGQEKSFFKVVQFALQKSDGITAVSQYLKDETLRFFQIAQEIKVIPNSVDTHQFNPNAKQLCQRQYFCKPDEFLFIHISNFRPVKHIHDVIEVFDRIQKQLKSRLILVGEGPDLLQVKELVAQKGLREKVHFLGSQQKVETLLALSDIFLLTSQFESFGLVALEAMSCGVPVFAVRGGGIVEVIEEGEDGYLFPPGEHDLMAQKAIELLRDPEKFRQMKQKCRENAQTKFNEEAMVLQYLNYYQKILDLP